MTTHHPPMKYRYNPRLGKPLAKVYRPWYFVFALCTILVGIAIVGCAVALKQFDSDIKDELFHLWVGIPLIFVAVLAVIAVAMRDRKVVALFLIVVIVVMTVCAASAILSGLRYWKDGWFETKRLLNKDNACSDVNGQCVCPSMVSMPSKQDCDDLRHIVRFVITEIALSGAGFGLCVAGTFLGFMSICCGPWQYMEDYDKHYDPDFSNNYPVQRRTYPQDINVEKAAHSNAGFSNGAPNEQYSH